MLELNDVALEAVSGGNWGSTKIKTTISNKNYADVDVKFVALGKNSTMAIIVSQSIG